MRYTRPAESADSPSRIGSYWGFVQPVRENNLLVVITDNEYIDNVLVRHRGYSVDPSIAVPSVHHLDPPPPVDMFLPASVIRAIEIELDPPTLDETVEINDIAEMGAIEEEPEPEEEDPEVFGPEEVTAFVRLGLADLEARLLELDTADKVAAVIAGEEERESLIGKRTRVGAMTILRGHLADLQFAGT